MLAYEIKLEKREEVAERTMAFFWEKPDGFAFKAGQYIDLTLLDPPETDEEGNTRAFSIASAPQQRYLRTATRLEDSAFKRVLKTMPLGTPVRIEGPMGSLTLHNNAARAGVLMAGGIGITPFLSIVRDAAEERKPHRLYLFYANKRPEEAAFLNELVELEAKNPNYSLVGVMTRMQESRQEWSGERKRIDREMLERYIGDLDGPIYYVAGPPSMAATLKDTLNQAGVDDDDIRIEEFAGY